MVLYICLFITALLASKPSLSFEDLPIHKVPSEVWVLVFKSLEGGDKNHFSGISHAFEKIADTSTHHVKMHEGEDIKDCLTLFSRLPNAHGLSFYITPTLSSLLPFLSQLHNLNVLNISGNIRNRDLLYASTLSNLQTLHLSWCKNITDPGLFNLSQSTHIQQLTLYFCNQMTDSGLSYLSHLKKMQTLDLSICEKITDKGLSSLTGLTTIQYLNLYRCQNITDKGLSFLSQLINLQHLDLSRCYQITDYGLLHLLALTHLQHLHLNGCNYITSAAKARLMAHLPRLKELC